MKGRPLLLPPGAHAALALPMAVRTQPTLLVSWPPRAQCTPGPREVTARCLKGRKGWTCDGGGLGTPLALTGLTTEAPWQE